MTELTEVTKLINVDCNVQGYFITYISCRNIYNTHIIDIMIFSLPYCIDNIKGVIPISNKI